MWRIPPSPGACSRCLPSLTAPPSWGSEPVHEVVSEMIANVWKVLVQPGDAVGEGDIVQEGDRIAVVTSPR